MKDFNILKIEGLNIWIWSLKEGNTLGYTKYSIDNISNSIYLYVEEKYRGNGYGKIMFEDLLNKIKESNINEIEIIVKRDNIPMIRIIEDFGGVNTGTLEGNSRYILPIKKNLNN